MKKYIVLLLVLLLNSCGTSSVKKTEEKPLFEILSQQSDGGANINFYEILTEPNEIRMLQNDEKLKRKIKPTDLHQSNFVILNMGEKPTGGYSIGVENVEETEKNIIITVKESNPEPDAMVTQNITYPFCVVKINSKKEIIIK